MSSNQKIGFFKLHPDATIPTRGTPLSAGWDLYAIKDYEVKDGTPTVVNTGVGVCLPPNHYGRIAPRSGNSIKGLCLNAGVVDADYGGELAVICYCSGSFDIKKGNRVAQIIVEKIYCDDMPEIQPPGEKNSHLGFGSTGN